MMAEGAPKRARSIQGAPKRARSVEGAPKRARSIERLLVAENDPPLRLVSLALGEPLDDTMRLALQRYFTDDVNISLARLRAHAQAAGLDGLVTPELATAEDLGAQLPGVHYLLAEGAQITDAMLASAGALRLIQKHGEDCRNIDLESAARRGIRVLTLRRRGNSDVAEHTLLLMLAVARRLLAGREASAAGQADALREASSYNWARLEGVVSLRERTLGVVGMGEIGRDLARKAAPFGMRVLYTQRRRLDSDLEHELKTDFRSLDDLLAESDVVSLHVPFNDETREMIDAARLQAMRPGSILINTSRGGLVDEQALIAALRSGHLAGAGLDVRPEEPPAPATQLTDLPNVVLTPHIGAGTGDALMADVREVLENIARARRGEV
jgi:phosphoglycerate dehydrogenase-like enzyme